MQTQLSHEQFKAKQTVRKNGLFFVLENLEHPENIGSAFRLADAFGVEAIVIISKNPFDEKKIAKTARGCQNFVPFMVVDSCDEALRFLNQNDIVPINLEITSTSKPLREINFAKIENVALIVGNERHGVSAQMLSKVPLSAHIDMFGNNSSLNVATALAIGAYHVCESPHLTKRTKSPFRLIGG